MLQLSILLWMRTDLVVVIVVILAAVNVVIIVLLVYVHAANLKSRKHAVAF